MVSTMRSATAVALTIAAFLALGCGAQQKGSRVSSMQLAEGMYRVEVRTCHGDEVEKATCDRIRYVEIVRGRFVGVGADELAIVQWSALDEDSGPFTYSARPLRGYAQNDLYMIDEMNLPTREAREWLQVQDDRLIAYRFEKKSNGALVRFELSLSPVVRDAALAARLPYPPPLDE